MSFILPSNPLSLASPRLCLLGLPVMQLPGQRRLTRRFHSEFHSRGLLSPSPLTSVSMFGSKSCAPAQPSLDSAPGSLAEQAAQMEHFGCFNRKSTEELFIQSFVESSHKVSLSSLPVADNLGLSQVAELDKFSRGDSEELFSCWVSAGSTPNQNSESITGAASPSPQRPRPESRRVSSELAAILKQQNNFNNNITLSGIDFYQRADGVDDVYMSSKSMLDSEESTPKSRLSNGSSDQARSIHDLFEPKIAQNLWLESQAPVTRSRSSELRRRIAEVGATAIPQVIATSRPLPYKEQAPAAATNGWNATHALASISVPDPSTSQRAPGNTSLSECVGMLKGSLNRARQRQGSQLGPYANGSEEAKGKKAQIPSMNGDITISPPGILDSSSIRMKQNNAGSKCLPPAVEKPLHANTDNVSSRSIDESFAYQNITVTQISDSSGGAPIDMICTSGQATLGGRSKSLKRGNAEIDHVSAEPISMSDLEGLEFQGAVKNQEHMPKIIPDTLRRMGSINSAARSDYAPVPLLKSPMRSPMRSPEQHAGPSTDSIDDATKKRRVDRQRKMAEAKGRGATSVAGPPDLQAALKRLDALEKEVRSLKMNLAFMNRKDSEQTKHIEELEEENKELKRQNMSLKGCDMQI